MSIIEVNEKSRGNGRLTFDSEEHVRIFDVKTDDYRDSSAKVLNNIFGVGDAPTFYGEAHPDRDHIFAQSFDLEPRNPGDNETKYWTLKVTYSTSKITPDIDQQEFEDPTEQPPQINFKTRTYQSALWNVYKDNEGIEDEPTGIPRNSAGSRFIPAPNVERHFFEITVKNNQDDYNPNAAKDAVGSVNGSGVTIAGVTITAQHGRLTEWSAIRRVDQNGDFYFEVTYRIEVHEESAQLRVPDMGEVDKDNKSKKDSTGRRRRTPVFFDGDGRFIDESQENPTILELKAFPEAEWFTLDTWNVPERYLDF